MTSENKRYQIFISSTFSDLKEERAEVTQAIMEINHMPYGMEAFPAANETQWEWIKRAIEESDYYIVIIGGKYGSVNPKTGLSYTEMEYQYAEQVGVPTIAFLVDNNVDLAKSKIEIDPEKSEKLKAFKDYIESKRMRKSYTSKEDLKAKVITSLLHLFNQYPRNGWIRSNSLKNYTPNNEVIKLMKENESLKNKENSNNKIAQGDDDCEIYYSVNNWNDSSPVIHDSIKIKWNEIFYHLGNSLYSEQKNEYELITIIQKLIGKNSQYSLLYSEEELFFIITITEKELKKILLQLEAIDLISKNMNGFWSLTRKGRKKYVLEKAEKKDN